MAHRSFTRQFLLALLAVAILAAAPRRAVAEPPPMNPAAKAHLDAGSRYFRVQELDKAIAEFKAGYLIDPQPNFLYAIAQAERLQGDCDKASVSYRQFLAAEQQVEAESGPATPEEQSIAKNSQAMLDECVAKQKAAAPPASVPASKPVAASQPASRPFVLVPAPIVRPRRAWWKDRLGLGLIGGGTVVALVGGGILLATAGQADESPGMSLGSYESQYHGYWIANEIGVGCLVAGGATAIAGAVRLFWVRRHGGSETSAEPGDESPTAAHLSVSPSGFSIAGAF